MLKPFIRSVFEKLQLVRGSLNRNDRAGALHRAWGYVFTNHMRGDYYEFGVYKGDALIRSFQEYQVFRQWIQGQTRSSEAWRRDTSKKYAEYHSGNRLRFVGLDTFDGMPANQEGNITFAQGTFQSDETEVVLRCSNAGLQSPQLVLLKGLFETTRAKLLSDPELQPAAIINLDCDLYASARDALAACEKIVQDGTVLLCDDYHCFNASNASGERKALREFCEKTRVECEPWFAYQFTGQAFLCHR